MMNNMLKKEIKKFLEVIEKKQNFAILVHRYPEGDAIGSQIALGLILKQLNKDVDMLNFDPIPWQFEFLDGSEMIKVKTAFDKDYDVGIILDSSDFYRTDYSDDDRAKIKTLVNIDHHLSNQYFGDINIVDPDASSTGEVIYKLSKKLNSEITSKIALNIYTAIVTDTGSFRYSNTSSNTLKIASKLVDKGIDVAWANENLFEIGTIGKIKLWGKALSDIELTSNNSIAILTVTQQMLEQFNAEFSDTENLINYGLSIIGVEVSLLFKELDKNKYKVSFRSKGKISVAKVAETFDGGGHFRAAGCKIKGSFEEVKSQVIDVVRTEFVNNNILNEKSED